jgi:hypothetical protein
VHPFKYRIFEEWFALARGDLRRPAPRICSSIKELKDQGDRHGDNARKAKLVLVSPLELAQ